MDSSILIVLIILAGTVFMLVLDLVRIDVVAIAAAEATIDLAAAYFVPDRLLIAARDRDVRILLPGPHMDSLTVKIASKAELGELLAAESYSLASWKNRPLRRKLYEKMILPIRSQL